MLLKYLLLIFVIIAIMVNADNQVYPGTSTRPVLSDLEAKNYTKEKYLQGWIPDKIKTSLADYVVGTNGKYSTIQLAVNAAINNGGSTRKYIKINPGTYKESVLIPKTTVPITLYGSIGSPEDVHIILSQGAKMSGEEYANQVNPNGSVYKKGDPAWSMYNSCATQTEIGTFCSSIFWTQNDNLEVSFITVENLSKDGQAVATRADGDMQHFDHVHLFGFQDTLLVSGKRIYFNISSIKGDIDFIFGSASAVFEGAQITARSDRPRNTALIFAPNTDQTKKYGFLVINSTITADSDIQAKKGCHLARAWDSTSTANGQLVIRNTKIDDVINEDAPYDAAASDGKAYSGNAAVNRNLDDSQYNRFWEYKNTGSGA